MQEIIYHHPSILDKTVKTIGKSFLIKYNKQIYFIGIHHGYPISYININKNNFDKDNLNICSWNEILFKNIDYTMDQFVFNKFSKKQINSSNFYYCDTKRLKYKNNHYFPINMLPGNVKNLYYVMECLNDMIKPSNSGSPVYDKDKKLIGIISKIKKNDIFVIPIIYLCNSIDKIDNLNIYTICERNPKSIESYNVTNNNIYHSSLKAYINKDTFLVLEGDINKDLLVDNIKIKYVTLISFMNNPNIILKSDEIIITSGLLNLIKLHNISDLLLLIFKNFKNKESIQYMGKEFIFN